MGGKAWTAALSWPGQSGFNNAPEKDWIVNGVKAGTSKSYQGFTWLEVLNAGRILFMNFCFQAFSLIIRRHGSNGPTCKCFEYAPSLHFWQAILMLFLPCSTDSLFINSNIRRIDELMFI